MNAMELAREFLELWTKRRSSVLTPAEHHRLLELETLLGDLLPRELLAAAEPPKDRKE